MPHAYATEMHCADEVHHQVLYATAEIRPHLEPVPFKLTGDLGRYSLSVNKLLAFLCKMRRQRVRYVIM